MIEDDLLKMLDSLDKGDFQKLFGKCNCGGPHNGTHNFVAEGIPDVSAHVKNVKPGKLRKSALRNFGSNDDLIKPKI